VSGGVVGRAGVVAVATGRVESAGAVARVERAARAVGVAAGGVGGVAGWRVDGGRARGLAAGDIPATPEPAGIPIRAAGDALVPPALTGPGDAPRQPVTSTDARMVGAISCTI
jgi:hypothetical protein